MQDWGFYVYVPHVPPIQIACRSVDFELGSQSGTISHEYNSPAWAPALRAAGLCVGPDDRANELVDCSDRKPQSDAACIAYGLSGGYPDDKYGDGEPAGMAIQRDSPAVRGTSKSPASGSPHYGNLLALSKPTMPELPAAPPPIASPIIPPGFIGCWSGDPGNWDWFQKHLGLRDFGAPGPIVICFTHDAVEFRSEHFHLTHQALMREIGGQLGLGDLKFHARGVKSEALLARGNAIRTRSKIDLIGTEYLLYFIPISKGHETIYEDEVFQLLGPNRMLVHARFVSNIYELFQLGTWHAYFHRVADIAPGVESARR
jgi:hypothetical protein